MTVYEKLNIILFGFTAISAVIGIFIALKQLKSDHDWRRRHAAQSALFNFNQYVNDERLQNETDFLNVTDSIPLEELTQKNIELLIYKLLIFYENLARGVLQNVYDEEVIKKARKDSMIRTYRAFYSYIKNRRKMQDNAFHCFEKVVRKWEYESTDIKHRHKTA